MFGLNAARGERVVTLYPMVQIAPDEKGIVWICPHEDPPSLCSYEPVVEGRHLLPGESPFDALCRFAGEQLGAAFASALRQHDPQEGMDIEFSRLFTREQWELATSSESQPIQQVSEKAKDGSRGVYVNLYQREFSWDVQPLARGLLLPDETPEDALHRIVSEQRGPVFAEILRQCDDFGVEYMFQPVLSPDEVALMACDAAKGEVTWTPFSLMRTVYSLAAEQEANEMMTRGH